MALWGRGRRGLWGRGVGGGGGGRRGRTNHDGLALLVGIRADAHKLLDEVVGQIVAPVDKDAHRRIEREADELVHLTCVRHQTPDTRHQIPVKRQAGLVSDGGCVRTAPTPKTCLSTRPSLIRAPPA